MRKFSLLKGLEAASFESNNLAKTTVCVNPRHQILGNKSVNQAIYVI